MSVVATPSVHALLREFVANSPRRHYLPDTEGIELSNQAALVREVVVAVQACLEPDLAAVRTSEPDDGSGVRVVVAVAQYDEILRTLLDTAPLIESGRMSTVWTLLRSAADRLRILTGLESARGDDVARHLATSATHARARFTAAATADDVDLGLSTAFCPAGAVSPVTVPSLPAQPPAIANLIEHIDLGAATGRDGSTHETDYDHLAMVGGYQLRLMLEIIRAATDSLCEIVDPAVGDDFWTEKAGDVRAAVEFAWDCV
ncbi:hypothetical protein [Prescottella agglutinans]|uniref:Uncharacterized protein n=1 Tax=Prescottella agglutinans TaxID=1644129 RepID=A0ABT6MAS2_9NOCA|nr:hypothetical protein [Prescottella agglutinans]MDH6280881.1 hypothetical protein [Prescottella agglutinans]